MKYSIGLDIGGTKCAVSAGVCANGEIRIAAREAFPTAGLHWQEVLAAFEQRILALRDNMVDLNLPTSA